MVCLYSSRQSLNEFPLLGLTEVEVKKRAERVKIVKY